MPSFRVGNQITTIDDDDVELFLRHTWHISGQYVCRSGPVFLHREILKPPTGMLGDHINGDKLDNRRCNLRSVTPSENGQNRVGPPVNSTTGVRNVQYRSDEGMYRVTIRVGGKRFYGGRHSTLAAAELAAIALRQRHMTHAPDCLEPPVNAPTPSTSTRHRHSKTCPTCNQSFIGVWHARYCSTDCKALANNRQFRDRYHADLNVSREQARLRPSAQNRARRAPARPAGAEEQGDHHASN